MFKGLYGLVRSLAQEVTKGRNLNFYSFLYGMIMVTTLPVDEIKEIVEEEADRDDITECVALIRQLNFDTQEVIDIIKDILADSICLDEKADEFDDFVGIVLNENSNLKMSEFLQKLFDAEGKEFTDLLNKKTTVAKKNKQLFETTIDKTKDLYQRLNGKIHGQSEAIRLFVQEIFKGKIFGEGLSEKVDPHNVFLLSGPVGAGKSFLVEETAKILGRPLLVVDLDEYEHNGAGRLFAPVSEEENGGRVTDFVANNSRGIICFKNLEHANVDTISKLSQILDTGIVCDDSGRNEVVFTDVTFIFVTTLGGYMTLDDKERNVSVLPQPLILDMLKQEISNEPLKKFFDVYFSANNIIMFNNVALHHLTDMVQDTFNEFCKDMERTYGIVTEIDPLVASVFLYTQSDDSNALATIRQCSSFLKNEIYELSRHLQKGKVKGFKKLQNIKFNVVPPVEKGPVRALLVNETVSEVLVIAEKTEWQGVRSGASFHLNFASDYFDAVEILREKDIKFCIIDLYYGQKRTSRQHYLSLDDVESTGLNCFENIRKNFVGLPIYLVDKPDMDQEDKITFIQRGTREFIKLGDNPKVIKRHINTIAQRNYVQGKRTMMNAKKKVLTYNTAQKISKEGKYATITFYDFATRTTVLEGCSALYDAVTYHPETCLDEYVGSEKVKNELKHLSTYLTCPRQFIIKEGAAPGGILLFGSEGVGKSTLARALAGEVDATFIAPEINTVQSLNPSYLERVFEVARDCAPSVLFIDNIERIGCDDSASGEKLRNILIENLVKLAKDVQHPVLFVGAMDYDDSHIGRDNTDIDSNLLVQLDYKIHVPLPEKGQRKKFLKKLMEKAKVNTISDEALENILQRTIWNTFVDLEEFFKIALRISRRKNKPLDDVTFISALDEFLVGGTTERDEKLHWEVAIHEAGHAYMRWKSGNHVAFATITPRGNYGGYVMRKVEEKATRIGTKEELLWEIRTSLASRAAEIVFLGKERGINAGISSDFENATNCALAIICRYGMDEDWLVSMPPDVILQSSLAGDVMKKVNNLLKTEFQNTLLIIVEGKKAVEALAKELLDKNQLTETEIETIIEKAEKEKK